MKSSVVNLDNYFRRLMGSLAQMPLAPIDAAIKALEQARIEGRTIFTMGNGGSASTASHFTCDLGKGTIQEGRPKFRAFCLNDNVSIMTAWANDTHYSNIFAGQIASFVQPGDVVVAISVGGNSPNVVAGMRAAKDRGACCIALVGSGGGRLETIADVAILVPNSNTEPVEDLHLLVCHAIAVCLRQRE